MTKITFYSVRHAQTTYNRDKLFTGWHNPSLTLEGQAQASLLNLEHYTHILTAKHKRCIDTIIYSKVNTSYETDCRLNEVCLGNLQGQALHNVKEYIDSPLDFTPLGGESYRLAYYRLLSLLYELYYRLTVNPNSKYLLCTSSGIVRILKALEYKPLIQDFHSIKTGNCIITKHTLGISDFYYLDRLH